MPPSGNQWVLTLDIVDRRDILLERMLLAESVEDRHAVFESLDLLLTISETEEIEKYQRVFGSADGVDIEVTGIYDTTTKKALYECIVGFVCTD